MPRASKTRVSAVTSEVFRGGSLIHLQNTQSWKITNLLLSGGVLRLQISPQMPWQQVPVGWHVAPWQWEAHLGMVIAPRTPSLSLHGLLGLLMESPDASQLQQWDLSFFAPSGQLAAGLSRRAVRSHDRAQNLPSLYQAVFLGISLGGGIGHLCNSVMLPASSLVHGCFDSCQAVAGPVFVSKLNTGLRMSQCEMLQAEPWTPSLFTSFRSTWSPALREHAVIILNFLPGVTASKMW